MREIMNKNQEDINPSDSSRENEVNVGVISTSFEDNFNSTFTRLEEMQDAIVAEKIAELEEELCELEEFALKIIYDFKIAD